MARVGVLAAADIDALWAALRPRILALATGGGTVSTVPGPAGPAGPKGITWRGEWALDTDYEEGDVVYLATDPGGSILTYFALDDHTSTAATKPVPGGVASYWHEVSPGYLIIDGQRAMTGALDMGHHSIDNADDADVEGTATVGEDVVFTEGIGGAKITSPRIISMAGDHEDDEAKLENLERVVFNDEPTASSIEKPSRIELNTVVEAGVDYTAAAGVTSWDTLEDAMIGYVASGAGVVAIALGWTIKLAVYTPGV